MTQQADERLGLPSASSFERRVFCPGSATLEPVCAPEQEDNEIARRGVAIHEALVTDDETQLVLSDKKVKDQLRAIEKEALAEWLKSNSIYESEVTILREHRLWIRNNTTLKPIASAKVDFAAVAEEKHKALIIDAKSGFLDTTPAELNWQIRVQAVALWHEYNTLLTDITGAISWGRGKGKFDPVLYDTGSLMWAESQILFYAENSKDPAAPRIPGMWCRYCRARTVCREHAAYALMPAIQASHDALIPPSIKKSEIPAKVAHMSPEALAWAYSRKTFLSNLMDAITDRLKGMLADDLKAIGLELKPNAPMRQITNIQAAYTALKERGLINDEEFRSLCKLGVGAVEELIVPRLVSKAIDAGGHATNDSATEELNRILARAIEMKPKSPSLKPIKPSK